MKSRQKQKAKNAPPRPPADKVSSAAPSPRLILGICAFLALMVAIVYGETYHFDFVNFDDEIYVYDNPLVFHGLTPHDMASAFSAQGIANWVPVTMFSHMLDCQLYGLNAGGHHLTNVLLHAVSAILLFLVLHRMTAALWR